MNPEKDILAFAIILAAFTVMLMIYAFGIEAVAIVGGTISTFALLVVAFSLVLKWVGEMMY